MKKKTMQIMALVLMIIIKTLLGPRKARRMSYP